MNITVDDNSPLFQWYSPANTWITNHNDDPNTDPQLSLYYDQTYHSTSKEGDSVKLIFNGSAISMFGAKRANYGIYTVELDGVVQTLSGAGSDVFQSLLFQVSGLSGQEHTLVVTNRPSLSTSPTNQSSLDIDYAVITGSATSSVYTTRYDDGSSAFTYNGTWGGPGSEWVGYYNNTVHFTSTLYDATSFNFNGSSVQLFGAVNNDHGNYSVSLDGGRPTVYTGYAFTWQGRATLYMASNLPEGLHKLEIINLGLGNSTTSKTLDIDYAVINSTNNPGSPIQSSSTKSYTSTSTTTTTSTPSSTPISGATIGGAVAGAVVAIGLIAVGMWYILRRRRAKKEEEKQRRREIDLTGEEVKPFPPTGGSGVQIAEYPSSVGIGDGPPAAREMSQTDIPLLTVSTPPETASPSRSVGVITAPSQGHTSTDSSGDIPSLQDQQYFDQPSSTTPPLAVALDLPPSSNPLTLHQTPTTHLPEILAKTKIMGVPLPYTSRPVQSNSSAPPIPPSTGSIISSNRVSSVGNGTGRMVVPGREVDFGPAEVDFEHDLPPDYHQATEPLPGQREV